MDSLHIVLRSQAEDSNKVLTLIALAEIPDLSTPYQPIDNRTVQAEYAVEALRLSQRLHWAKGVAYGAMYASMAQEQQGDLEHALLLLDTALAASENLASQERGTVLQRAALVQMLVAKNYDIADSLALLSISCFRTSASTAQIGSGLELLGRVQLFRKNWVKAILAYTEAIRFCERNRLPKPLAIANEKMGYIMATLGDMDKAGDYYRKGIHLSDSLGDGYRKFMGESNFGTVLIDNDHPAQALHWLVAARETALSNGLSPNELYNADCLRAQALLMLDSVDAAGKLIRSLRETVVESPSTLDYIESIWLLKERRPHEAIAMLLPLVGYVRQGGVELDQMNRTICDQLAIAYRQLGQHATALAWTDSLRHWERVLHYRGEVNAAYRVEAEREIQDRVLADSLAHVQETHRLALESERKVSQEKARRNGFLFAGIGVLLVAGGLWNRLRQTRSAKLAVEREQAISEDLLLNILPAEVAAELKVKGEAVARQIDQVTVLFTDFKGFTAMSEVLSPPDLVKDLNECFSAFDRITEKYGIEKIKTIGDAYMAAGGLPTPNTTHATDVIMAAFEMRDFIAEGKARKVAAGLPFFEIRIGIHTGPVVAGIVGVKKFQYDIWGDTVNTASRMESSGEVGQVNISEATYALVKNEQGLTFTPRGKVRAKGKGDLEMYFVKAV